MNLGVIFRILGTLLMLFSLTHLPPVMVSLYYKDGDAHAFIATFLVTLFSGFALWALTMNNHRELRTRDCFMVVTLFWAVLGLFGSIPFLFSETLHMSVTDSLFESISGLTTTGATVLTGLDELPKSILYYRQ
jgi:trk system potassium uptake protein TrkH